ncbi:hypothetical protein NP493_240g01088 [Ridgeia piscesae]|uniref:Uncharacterized protein n=1 Tax=Ridgeia piscesae TaxID=27915 RepID=A0AAD9NZE3_RIDPI|nr:hypothetical protein NP493_240g01088 [Ridgeia piscesae]
MKKAELLNTTREEQILKKQQILEELQKVEAELHEKAKAQLLLNVEQKQRSQQQQLLQQQVQLAAAAMQQQQGAAAVAGAGGDKGKGAPSFHSLLKNQLELTKKAVLNMGKSDSAESSVSSTNCAEGYAGGGGAGAGGEAEKPALAKQESLGSASSMSADSGCGNSDNNCLGREGAGQPDGMEARGDGKGDGRAGSEDVDLSNVMPFRDQKQAEGDDTDTVTGDLDQAAADGEQPQAVQLQQQRHLQQQKQQLQAQLVLQQQLQHELQQQLQLQQEHQQLQQQLKAHQVQMQLQQQDLQVGQLSSRYWRESVVLSPSDHRFRKTY